MDRRHEGSGKEFNPETLALGLGYDPFRSEGSVKPPVFLTSTFQFESADAGKRFFELAYGLREPEDGEERGLIYSRINNPNLQIFEERVAAWDKSEAAATFASGMAAIATTVLGLVEPGDTILSTAPVYGGTHYLFERILEGFGVEVAFARAGSAAPRELRATFDGLEGQRVPLLFVETPANPNNLHSDIAAIVELAREITSAQGASCRVLVDNTLLGPVFQRPSLHGADLVVYSATKFLGGHSDLVAGVVTGRAEALARVLELRTILGTTTTPFNGWLLLRSLETVSVRMRRQAKSARVLAEFLAEHPRVTRVLYPGLVDEGDPQHDIWRRQCTGTGSLISFEVEGGVERAFEVLDRFEVFRLAVSLGGTESLVEHPMHMTHSDVARAEQEAWGITPGLIRMSVGLEHLSDLRRDLAHALG